MNHNAYMHEMNRSCEKLGRNPFDDPQERMDFEIKLRFETFNQHGVEIYCDPNGQYVYKSARKRTPFNYCPMVCYQGDKYLGEDGAYYVVTRYPYLMDSFGVLWTIVFSDVNHTSDADGYGSTEKVRFIPPKNSIRHIPYATLKLYIKLCFIRKP